MNKNNLQQTQFVTAMLVLILIIVALIMLRSSVLLEHQQSEMNNKAISHDLENIRRAFMRANLDMVTVSNILERAGWECQRNFELVNIGSAPNAGDGDTVSTAALKLNNALLEIGLEIQASTTQTNI